MSSAENCSLSKRYWRHAVPHTSKTAKKSLKVILILAITTVAINQSLLGVSERTQRVTYKAKPLASYT